MLCRICLCNKKIALTVGLDGQGSPKCVCAFFILGSVCARYRLAAYQLFGSNSGMLNLVPTGTRLGLVMTDELCSTMYFERLRLP